MKEFLETPQFSKQNYNNYQLGKYISTNLDEVKAKSIVLMTVDSFVGHTENTSTSFQNFRNALYQLTANNWKLSVVDLGTIHAGNSFQDTLYAVKETVQYCLVKKAFPLVIGGSQDLVYALFQAIENQHQPLTYTGVDFTIPLSPDPEEKIANNNLLNHLLAKDSQSLFHYTNIGYQSYYTSYQIVDTIDSLNFEAIRLGEICSDLKESEPIFRSSDVASINMESIACTQKTDQLHALPNGFNSREICALSKFAGLSSQLKIMGIFNYIENSENQLRSELLAHMVWYYIEGKNASLSLKNTQKKYLTFRVMHEDKEIVFCKDDAINKWWIVLENEEEGEDTLIPCTENDYEKAKNNEIPDRYWKSIKRFL